jgi:hypothetical protein
MAVVKMPAHLADMGFQLQDGLKDLLTPLQPRLKLRCQL